MFSMELLYAVLQKALGDAATKIFARGIDTKHRFARRMLSYYEDLKDYKKACVDLLSLIHRERELVRNRRITPGTAKHFQEISDRMHVLAERLIEPFEHEWEAETESRNRSHNKPRRNMTLFEIYDANLAAALHLGRFADTHSAYLAAELSKQYIDWEKQQIVLFPRIGVHPFEESEDGMVMSAAEEPSLRLDFTNDDDLALLINSLEKSTSLADEIASRLAGFLKEHFTVEDLL